MRGARAGIAVSAHRDSSIGDRRRSSAIVGDRRCDAATLMRTTTRMRMFRKNLTANAFQLKYGATSVELSSPQVFIPKGEDGTPRVDAR